MRRKMLVCACVFSLFAGAVAVANAAPAAQTKGPPQADSAVHAGDSVHQKWWAQLNLTDDQKAKLKSLRADMKDFRKANFGKMKALLDKSKEELLKAAPSKSVLYGYAKEMGDLHKAMSERMADHLMKMKTILSREQFQKFLNRDFLQGMGRPGKGPRPPHDGPQGMMPPPGDADD